MSVAGRRLSAEERAVGLLAGNRALLARAITTVESRRPEDQAVALDLLDRILPHVDIEGEKLMEKMGVADGEGPAAPPSRGAG